MFACVYAVDNLAFEITSTYKIGPSVGSQASKREHQPLKRSEHGTATSQASKLEHQYRERSENGNATSQDNERERQPQKRSEDGTAASQDRDLESEPLYQTVYQTEYYNRSRQWSSRSKPSRRWGRGRDASLLPSVTELRKAGIEFKGEKGGNS